MARPRLVASFVGLALLCGTVLTGCAHQDASGLVDQACSKIERGLAAERQAASAGPVEASRLKSEALGYIRAALPLAAVAAGEDTTWQALDATLSESNRVPLSYLLPALAAQCAGVSGGG